MLIHAHLRKHPWHRSSRTSKDDVWSAAKGSAGGLESRGGGGGGGEVAGVGGEFLGGGDAVGLRGGG